MLVSLAAPAQLPVPATAAPGHVVLPEKIMMKKMKPMMRGCVFSCFRTFCLWDQKEQRGEGRDTPASNAAAQASDQSRTMHFLPLQRDLVSYLPEAEGLLATAQGSADELLALGVGHALGGHLRRRSCVGILLEVPICRCVIQQMPVKVFPTERGIPWCLRLAPEG